MEEFDESKEEKRQLIFGLTAGHLSLWLRFARRCLLVRILRDDPLAKVMLPTEHEIWQFEEAIVLKYPALERCWGAMDGLKLRLEKAGDEGTQNNFYNGWTHDHYISNLFLFFPDGRNNIDAQGKVRQRSAIHRQATSVRQLSEWGMRGLQGSFPRLKDRLMYEERGERRIILEMIVLLYNYRASTVGINQIQSSFMPHLKRNGNSFMYSY